MKIHICPRQSGKTYWQIMGLKTNEKVILMVFSEQEKQRLIKDFHLDDNHARRIVTPFSLDRLQGLGNVTINIDNLDLVLPMLMGNHNIGLITTTEG